MGVQLGFFDEEVVEEDVDLGGECTDSFVGRLHEYKFYVWAMESGGVDCVWMDAAGFDVLVMLPEFVHLRCQVRVSSVLRGGRVYWKTMHRKRSVKASGGKAFVENARMLDMFALYSMKYGKWVFVDEMAVRKVKVFSVQVKQVNSFSP